MTSVDKNTLTRLTGRKPDKLAQQVKDLADVSPKNLPEGKLYHITEKLDGVYAFFLFLAGFWQAFTRTGERIHSCEHLEDHLEGLNLDKSLVIIGELLLIYRDGYVWKYAPVGETSGAVRRHEQNSWLNLVVHDCLTQKEFREGYSSVHFTDRLSRLAWIHVNVKNPYEVTRLVRFPASCRGTKDDAVETAKEVFSRKGEGVILRDPEALWEAGKRDHRIMRIKERITKDLEVVGVKEGVGKMAGMAGSLLCRWKTPDGTLHEIPVAGGDFAQRTAWLQRPWQIVGKIIEVEAMKMTPDGFLREPRYKGVRFDKTEADC
ncbi:hypothetical protein DBR00_02540 [Pseudomonas sp. HMWF032]|uniref:ATP-dependent DNA ligase n=1 Tax=Pseudomonas sp. HMWF032 TaxID=2056866 RepID=UPI000D342C7D|nr:hypothetical protein [Pseudomonas sp. HMWF032]PTS86453.1 hypothetical protein DBR00_02540 [Pseudomonas sp. HMWF032]PTT81358.1 hypothetical protein DBR41_16990 [Pseudomonas sp. HMWF010]